MVMQEAAVSGPLSRGADSPAAAHLLIVFFATHATMDNDTSFDQPFQ